MPADREALQSVVHGLYWLTANLAAQEPVLLAVDDLHLVDGPSQRYLAYLARRFKGSPVALVVAVRPAAPDEDRALVESLLQHELAHACGATRLAEHARDELRATGARPRRLAVSGAQSLTAAERRVAELASTGLTNRRIAQELFVTTAASTIAWGLPAEEGEVGTEDGYLSMRYSAAASASSGCWYSVIRTSRPSLNV
jgi:hypothetical protein